MKKLSIWCIMIFTLLIGFTSCEDIEELEDCPEVSIEVDNETGSAVYRFAAQIDGIEDIRFTWSIDGEEVDTGNLEDLKDQILDYRFEPGTYTVCVKVANQDCPIEVCTEIEVEIDENDPCPDLFFEARQYERPSKYKFIADFRGINEVSYGWFINGEFVEDSSPNEDNYLIWDFEVPGRYEVCIGTETPDCPEGVMYCKVIEVEEVDERCPEISFTKELEPGTDNTYVFEANIEQTDNNIEGEILWIVNGEVIENPSGSEDGNRILIYQFEDGVHEVCLKVITENCPDGVTYCKEIRVGENNCPELFFEAEQDGDNAAYYFYPSAFDGIDDTVLSWFVNGDFVGTSPEFPHNNPFYWQFDGPGSYEVCVMVETPDCPNGASFCKVIEIEDTATDCPELFFEYEQEGDTPGYNFYASFEGMNDVSYEWMINGDVVDTEMVDSNDRDDYMYTQFSPGTYEICIFTETPDCPNGTSYCKTLVIE